MRIVYSSDLFRSSPCPYIRPSFSPFLLPSYLGGLRAERRLQLGADSS